MSTFDSMNDHTKEMLKTKSKIEKNPDSVKPTVINDKLIKNYMVQYHKDYKIFDKEDMQIWELDHLSLSYLNIVSIDNLNGMEKLRKLQLDNNIICEIRNLDKLVNLEWLDLSFNSIERIEGLDKCTKITDLSLYSNQIRDLSGLEKLTELNVLSVGSNQLNNLEETVKYLRGLKNKLQVLKVSPNQFSKRGDGNVYAKYIIANLKELQYLDYELITETARSSALEEHKDSMHDTEAEQEGDSKGEEDTAATQAMKEAHIYNTVNLLGNAIDSLGEEEQKVTNFSKFQDCFQTTEGQLEDFTQKFQTDMKLQHEQKMKIIKFCSNELREAELKAERDSIEKIEAYKKKEKHIYRDIEQRNLKNEQLRREQRGDMVAEPDFDGEEAKLNAYQTQLYGELMDIEINLQEALDTSRKTFITRVGDIITDQKNCIQNYISEEVKSEIDAFCDKFYEQAVAEFDRLKNMTETMDDVDELEAALAEYGGEAFQSMILSNAHEDIVQTLNNFREQLTARITKQDNLMSQAIDKEWQTLRSEMIDRQHLRNRAIIEEIVETIDKLGTEVSKQFTTWRNVDVD